MEYSTGDLDLLAEVADAIGTVVSLSNLQPARSNKIMELVSESDTEISEMMSLAGNLMSKIELTPDTEFIRNVEDSLRSLSDYIALGESSLADMLQIKADSHIDRGKELHKLISESIESMKPGDARPSEPLPRLWYNYAVLHDAYVEDIPNREIMARLYISEGTFNRTRRNAVRGLARLIIQKSNSGNRLGDYLE